MNFTNRFTHAATFQDANKAFSVIDKLDKSAHFYDIGEGIGGWTIKRYCLETGLMLDYLA